MLLTRTWHYDRWLSANHYHDNCSCPKHPPATSQPASAPTFGASALASKQLIFTEIPRKSRRNEGVAELHPKKRGSDFSFQKCFVSLKHMRKKQHSDPFNKGFALPESSPPAPPPLEGSRPLACLWQEKAAGSV